MYRKGFGTGTDGHDDASAHGRITCADAAVIVFSRPAACQVLTDAQLHANATASLHVFGRVLWCASLTPEGSMPIVAEYESVAAAERTVAVYEETPSKLFSIHLLNAVLGTDSSRLSNASSSQLSNASSSTVDGGAPVPAPVTYSLPLKPHVPRDYTPLRLRGGLRGDAGFSQGHEIVPRPAEKHVCLDSLAAAGAALFEFSCQEALRGGPAARCTLMIRHVPSRWGINELLAVVDVHICGFWDLMYLPCKTVGSTNAGYAFINATSSLDALRLYQGLHGRPWPCTGSSKVCEIRYARLQGAQLTEHLLKAPQQCPRRACGYLALRGPHSELRIRGPTKSSGGRKGRGRPLAGALPTCLAPYEEQLPAFQTHAVRAAYGAVGQPVGMAPSAASNATLHNTLPGSRVQREGGAGGDRNSSGLNIWADPCEDAKHRAQALPTSCERDVYGLDGCIGALPRCSGSTSGVMAQVNQIKFASSQPRAQRGPEGFESPLYPTI